jgi:hypothetical protein
MKRQLFIFVFIIIGLCMGGGLVGCGANNQNNTPAVHTHNFSVWKTITEPTCEETGLRALFCPDDDQYEQTEVIPALGHDYIINSRKDATCVNDGWIRWVCSHNSEHTFIEEITKLGHDDGEWVTTLEPTCEEEGEKELRCTRDGTVLDAAKIPALGHLWADEWESSLKYGMPYETNHCLHDYSHMRRRDISVEIEINTPTTKQMPAGYSWFNFTTDGGGYYKLTVDYTGGTEIVANLFYTVNDNVIFTNPSETQIGQGETNVRILEPNAKYYIEVLNFLESAVSVTFEVVKVEMPALPFGVWSDEFTLAHNETISYEVMIETAGYYRMFMVDNAYSYVNLYNANDPETVALGGDIKWMNPGRYFIKVVGRLGSSSAVTQIIGKVRIEHLTDALAAADDLILGSEFSVTVDMIGEWYKINLDTDSFVYWSGDISAANAAIITDTGLEPLGGIFYANTDYYVCFWVRELTDVTVNITVGTVDTADAYELTLDARTEEIAVVGHKLFKFTADTDMAVIYTLWCSNTDTRAGLYDPDISPFSHYSMYNLFYNCQSSVVNVKAGVKYIFVNGNGLQNIRLLVNRLETVLNNADEIEIDTLNIIENLDSIGRWFKVEIEDDGNYKLCFATESHSCQGYLYSDDDFTYSKAGVTAYTNELTYSPERALTAGTYYIYVSLGWLLGSGDIAVGLFYTII